MDELLELIEILAPLILFSVKALLIIMAVLLYGYLFVKCIRLFCSWCFRRFFRDDGGAE